MLTTVQKATVGAKEKDKMNIIVQKYGGSSVGNIDKIKMIADRIIESKKHNSHLVIVVSAMGDTTDELIQLSKDITENPDPREYDALISNGENISSSLLAMTLISKGIQAISLTGLQAGIKTETTYSRAKIIDIHPERIYKELKENKVVIVTGFQGINTYSDVTTIGRGGSDTSAVALAASLSATECDICTDVDGVYTTDPRRVKSAQKIKEISYEEMLELASLGAKVLHPRSVECAKENNIIIHVRSSFSNSMGTIVKEKQEMEINRPVTGIALNEDEATVSILRVPDTPGIAGKLFSNLAAANINVDMIVQSIEENRINNITFTVTKDDLNMTKRITDIFSKEHGAEGIKWDDAIAKISIVGVGMISKPGIAARMFQVLGTHHINIQFISTSEIKISCVVSKEDGQKALEVLHHEFNLDQV